MRINTAHLTDPAPARLNAADRQPISAQEFRKKFANLWQALWRIVCGDRRLPGDLGIGSNPMGMQCDPTGPGLDNVGGSGR
ncbi:hypothetical protein [Mycobacterium sp. Z3061]|uniref:hypothetical protein n=1 Tax=Mycobacterium sp. Z3061 TaxID=3073562 RepID=UPI002877C1DC|nr:hypothetical protein [Mycobacterium sp. Z3061]